MAEAGRSREDVATVEVTVTTEEWLEVGTGLPKVDVTIVSECSARELEAEPAG